MWLPSIDNITLGSQQSALENISQEIIFKQVSLSPSLLSLFTAKVRSDKRTGVGGNEKFHTVLGPTYTGILGVLQLISNISPPTSQISQSKAFPRLIIIILTVCSPCVRVIPN